MLKQLLSHLGLSQNILLHGKQRGIYFGYLFPTKLEPGYDPDTLETVETIYRNWKVRWCDARVKNLVTSDRIQTTFRLYTPHVFETEMDFKQYVLPPITRKYIDDSLIKRILTYKPSGMTMGEICDKINANLPFCVSINDVSKIFTGKTIPEMVDDEYTELFNAERVKRDALATYGALCANGVASIQSGQRSLVTESKTKLISLTRQAIDFIMGSRFENVTTEEVSARLKSEYGTVLKRNIIGSIWKGKLKCLDTETKRIIQMHSLYTKVVDNKIQRVIRRKFTNDELAWIRNYTGSLTNCCKDFEKLYNKTVTRAYVSNLKNSNQN